MRAIPGVEAVQADSYSRTVQFGEQSGIITVQPIPNKNQLRLSVPTQLANHLQLIAERIRRLFDLQADPAEISEHLSQDVLLAPTIARYPGLRLPGCWDGFEIAVRAVLGQQVSVKAATTISGRLVERLGTRITAVSETAVSATHPSLTHTFPTPTQIVSADLSKLGLTTKRAETIRTLAQAVVDRRLRFSTPSSLEEAVDSMVQLPGIGDWTAQYIAMRALGEPDAFPAGDLILRRAATTTEKTITEKQLRQRAAAWRPWRAYAAIYLWKSYVENISADFAD
jgi:AraC family transcriptional regulator of adaptative response / DNA-3-methyladenine glycosylase II